jgi:hypothetical protein
VHQARHLLDEHLAQRTDVGGEGVDQGDAAGPGDLQQGQLGEVGAFSVELGVEGVGVRRCGGFDDGGEAGFVVDPAELGRRRLAAYGSIPVAVGWPASIQAPVPPATLTASMPWVR